MEMGARDLLATITAPKLRKYGSALETYILPDFRDVVMLSNHRPESSILQFMQYIKNTHDVASVLLQFHCLDVTAEICNNAIAHQCRCIVIEVENDRDIKILAS